MAGTLLGCILQGQSTCVVASILYIRLLVAVQGYLAHQKHPPPGTLQWGHARGPMVVLEGGGLFLMSVVPPHPARMPPARALSSSRPDLS